VIKGGNTPTGYQNFVMVMGVANATKPYAEGRDAGFPGNPVFFVGMPPKSESFSLLADLKSHLVDRRLNHAGQYVQ
jgi:hypothetical protein